MVRSVQSVVRAIVAIVVGSILWITAEIAPALAAESLGQKVFSANCSACHIGGNNVILAEKNLHLEALKKYGMDAIPAIKTQVTNGKNAMPAFGSSLTAAEIEAVARYVLSQAAQDWKDSSIDLQSIQLGSPRSDKPNPGKTNGGGS